MNLIKNLKKEGIVGVLIISLFLILISIASCSSPNSKTKFVRIFYLPQDLSVMTPIDSCIKIFDYSDIMKDTIIKDETFIKILKKKIDNLSLPIKQDTLFDFRIRCVLKMENGDKKVLCLGEFFDTTYEGKVFEDDPKLFELIKEVIYE